MARKHDIVRDGLGFLWTEVSRPDCTDLQNAALASTGG